MGIPREMRNSLPISYRGAFFAGLPTGLSRSTARVSVRPSVLDGASSRTAFGPRSFCLASPTLVAAFHALLEIRGNPPRPPHPLARAQSRPSRAKPIARRFTRRRPPAPLAIGRAFLSRASSAYQDGRPYVAHLTGDDTVARRERARRRGSQPGERTALTHRGNYIFPSLTCRAPAAIFGHSVPRAPSAFMLFSGVWYSV